MPNKLYTAIAKLKANFPATLNFRDKTDRNNAAYFLLDLPLHRTFLLQDDEGNTLRLSEQHISAYEQANVAQSYFGEYHYTATFVPAVTAASSSSDEGLLKLHIYFSAKDALTTAPQLSYTDNQGLQKTLALSPEFAAELLQLGIEQTTPTINQLRAQVSTYIAQQKLAHETLEAKLTDLSTDLNNNQSTYLAKMTEAMAVVEALAELDNRSFYQGVKQIYTAIEKKLRHAKPVTSATTSQTKKPQQPERATSSTSAITKNMQKAVAKPQPAKSTTTKIPSGIYLKCAEKAINTFQELTGTFKAKVKAYLAIDTALRDIIPILDDLEVEQLQVVEQMRKQARSMGIALLKDLLRNGEFELAKNIGEFTQDLAEEMVTSIFTTEAADETTYKRNASLLNFILATTDFPVDTFLIDNMTLVSYCCENHKATASKAHLLSVLVARGASLMSVSPDGLPYAHHLVAFSHPLHGVLIEHADKTLDSGYFYRRLVRTIDRILTVTDAASETCDKLKEFKQQYLTKINIIKLHAASNITASSWSEASEDRHNFTQSLLDDPQIRAAQKAYKQSFDTVQALQPKHERAGKKANYHDQLAQLREKANDINFSNVDMEQVKIDYIALTECLTRYNLKLVEFIELNNELKKARGNSQGRLQKNQRRLQSRIRILSAELLLMEQELNKSRGLGKANAECNAFLPGTVILVDKKSLKNLLIVNGAKAETVSDLDPLYSDDSQIAVICEPHPLTQQLMFFHSVKPENLDLASTGLQLGELAEKYFGCNK